MDCQTGLTLKVDWLRTTDLPIVWPLLRSGTARRWTRPSLVAYFEGYRECGMWVEERGKPCAVLLYRCNLQTMSYEIADMSVRRDRRRRGIGRGLMATFQTHVRNMPSKGIEAILNERALDAQLFLRACGFQAWGIARRWFGDDGDDGYCFHWE